MTDEKHYSDCAVNNAPALPVGPCDCGGYTESDALMDALWRVFGILDSLSSGSPVNVDMEDLQKALKDLAEDRLPNKNQTTP